MIKFGNPVKATGILITPYKDIIAQIVDIASQRKPTLFPRVLGRSISPRRQIIIQKANSVEEFYLKGIYPIEVLSEAHNGLVEVRTKTTFLHTSAYSDGKRQVRVGVTQKRWVRRGEVLRVPFRQVWSHRRQVAKGHA